ncbi:MAG: hypothetical protein IPL03_18730 [Sterolibacteriaceae bacterium]|nr:hypothetical protein [Candidatus Methylophosphatis haderslevensis]
MGIDLARKRQSSRGAGESMRSAAIPASNNWIMKAFPPEDGEFDYTIAWPLQLGARAGAGKDSPFMPPTPRAARHCLHQLQHLSGLPGSRQMFPRYDVVPHRTARQSAGRDRAGARHRKLVAHGTQRKDAATAWPKKKARALLLLSQSSLLHDDLSGLAAVPVP